MDAANIVKPALAPWRASHQSVLQLLKEYKKIFLRKGLPATFQEKGIQPVKLKSHPNK